MKVLNLLAPHLQGFEGSFSSEEHSQDQLQ